jgi:hypothetical protein
LPFTFADILLMLGLALAAGFFIFLFVKGPAKGPDER